MNAKPSVQQMTRNVNVLVISRPLRLLFYTYVYVFNTVMLNSKGGFNKNGQTRGY